MRTHHSVANRYLQYLQVILVLAAISATATVRTQAQPRVESRRALSEAVHEAERIAGEGDYGTAIGRLQSALDSAIYDEARADAMFALTRMNFESHRYPATYSISQSFLHSYPNDYRADDVLFMLAVASYEESRPAEADKAFRSVLQHCDSVYMPNFIESVHRNQLADWSNYWVSRIAADGGHNDTAEYYAWKAVAYRKNLSLYLQHRYSPEAIYLLGWLMERRNEFDTADVLYSDVVEKYPMSSIAPDAQLRRGVIEAHRKNYKRSLSILKAIAPAIMNARQSEEQLYYLTEVSAALGQWDSVADYAAQFLVQFPESPRNRHMRYTLGWAQRMMKKYDDAIATFRQLGSANDSLTASGFYQIGAIQLARSDTNAALGTFQLLVQRVPYESFSDDAYFQIGRIFYRRARYDSAAFYMLTVARQFPSGEWKADAYYLLGESQFAMRDNANAQIAFSRAARYADKPSLRARATYREAIALYRVGRFRSAISRLRDYTAAFPDGADVEDATFWLGEALYQDRSYPEAERYYASLIDKYPNSTRRPEAQYGLAWSQMQQKHFTKAAESFNKFLTDNPNNVLQLDATLALAGAYRYSGKYDDAIRIYQSIAKISGVRGEEAKARLAEVFLDMKQPDKAIETYRTLIQDYPSSPLREQYAFNIGQIYRDAGNDSLALQELKNFLTLFPRSELIPQTLFTIGDAYYNMPVYDSAIVYYRRVLEEYPNSAMVPEALDAVRYALEGAGRGGEAVAVIDSFQQKNPGRLPADSLAFRKSTILYEQAEYMKAIETNRKTLADFPESPLRPEIMYQLGRSYERVARYDSAVIAYSDILVRKDSTGNTAEKALMSRAGVRLRTSNLPEAVRDFKSFISSYPQSERISEAHYMYGLTCIILKDTSTALTEFNAAIVTGNAVAGDSTKESGDELSADKSRVAIAKILISRKQTDSAMTMLVPVISRRLDEISAEALLIHADLMSLSGDIEGAIAEFKRLTTDLSDFVDYAEPGMLMLGKLYERQNAKSAAKELYTKLAETTKDPKRKKEAETRLKKLR